AIVDFFFFSSRRRHTRSKRDWSSDVCSSDLPGIDPNSGGTALGFPLRAQLSERPRRKLRGAGQSPNSRPGRTAEGSANAAQVSEIGRASCREKCRDRDGRGDEKEKETEGGKN